MPEDFSRLIGIEISQHDGDDLRVLEPDELGDFPRVHPFQRLQPFGRAADVDTVDDAGGFVLAQRVDQHLAQKFLRADPYGRLAFHGRVEFGDDALDLVARDAAQLRHGRADALHLFCAHVLEYLGGFGFPECQQQNGSALGARARAVLAFPFIHRWPPSRVPPALPASDRS